MARYPIFMQEGSTQRICKSIRSRVVSLIDLEPNRTLINSSDGGGVTAAMTLESASAHWRSRHALTFVALR
jgi:hypothetical protein